jgi:hypothetical protein
LACQFLPLLLSTDNSQFTIRVINNSTKGCSQEGKNKAHFRLELFFAIAIIRHSVVCSMIS